MGINSSVLTGQIQILSPLVRRITAPNPSFMTGPGTNTYLIGKEDITIIDPGPVIDSHIAAILNACNGKLRRIIATHTHPDHSPAAAPLAAATGADVMGNTMPDDGIQDTTFQPVKSFVHNENLVTNEYTLKAILTPGHVDNHVCFLLEQEELLLAGDHLMNGSTVVIVPPGGKLKAYLQSLNLILNYPVKAIAPAHGEVFTHPQATIEAIIKHRLKREDKVINVLKKHGNNTIDNLLVDVYDDVDTSRHEVAKLSLEAHLIKLQDEKKVSFVNNRWVWDYQSN